MAAKAMASAKNDKSAAKALFELVGLEAEKYRLGHTKVLSRKTVSTTTTVVI